MNKTRRSSIVNALVDKLKDISLVNGYETDLGGQVFSKQKFLDEISEWPTVCVVAGSEQIVHQGGGYKDRYLNLKVTIYINEEESVEAVERLMEDIERIIDNNGRLAYLDSSNNLETTRDIIINTIDTDQGALAPLGVGEMSLQVSY